MNWFTVLMIILGTGLVIGPVMALMPNRSQRQLAQMRTRAASLGLQIRLVDFSKKNNQSELGSLACYILPWSSEELPSIKSLKSWQLIKGEMDHEIHFSGVWDWASPNLSAQPNWHQPLKHLIETGKGKPLFEQIKIWELNPQGVQIYWSEKTGVASVDQLAELLNKIKAFALQQSPNLDWQWQST